VLPQINSPVYPRFIEARNGIALDELQAHTGMFGAKTNDGYYDLGLETAKLIREAITHSKGVDQHEEEVEQDEVEKITCTLEGIRIN